MKALLFAAAMLVVAVPAIAAERLTADQMDDVTGGGLLGSLSFFSGLASAISAANALTPTERQDAWNALLPLAMERYPEFFN